MLAARVCAVLAAMFLVASVALGALLPLGANLADGLLLVNSGSLAWLRRLNSPWTWEWLSLPVLARPVWMVPAGLGLIFAGLAATFNLGRASPSRRKL